MTRKVFHVVITIEEPTPDSPPNLVSVVVDGVPLKDEGVYPDIHDYFVYDYSEGDHYNYSVVVEEVYS